MASGGAVWGIDVGQCALKAMKIRPAGDGKLELLAFDLIEHPKILSQPDAEPDELIAAAIEKFVSRNDIAGDGFVIGVPGQQTFARFCKLPPVADKRRLPDLVRYEAQQQIPFDMDDVVWDYQVFSAADSPDTEVGIFAMRKDLVRKHIDYFTAHRISPLAIQTIPTALFNAIRYDGQGGGDDGAATVLVDVGAQNTDLIIVEKSGGWMRNIPLGGNSFTDALIKSFKLSFAKAEQLKRQAASSKYARQIFQAMRPVFADLVAEIQRSLGHYASTHRDVELRNVLALGNAFLLPGLQKYLETNLTIAGGVLKLEKFNALAPSATVNAPQFQGNILSFAAAYGLALQGLGLAQINADLLPVELARVAMWRRKQPLFLAGAATLVLAAALPWTRNLMDRQALGSDSPGSNPSLARTQQIISWASEFQQRFSAVRQDTGGEEERIKRAVELTRSRYIIPRLLALVNEAMPELPAAIARAANAEELKRAVTADASLARAKRKQILIEDLKLEFSPNIESMVASSSSGPATPAIGGFGTRGGGMSGGAMAPPDMNDPNAPVSPDQMGFFVRVSGRLTYGANQAEATEVLESEYLRNLKVLGGRPGMGFYVMEKDPQNPDRNNENVRLFSVSSVRMEALGGVAPPGGGRAPGGSVTPSGAAPSEDEFERRRFADPATGEDTRTDWRFELGFKVRFGEKPPPEQAQ
ncbi:MAG: type IV pilus assembly protein PilM [Planctomycetia bacterium]|nr:MAG: type IV pilus assembly protein PilM [Planctomycetia bacterium]